MKLDEIAEDLVDDGFDPKIREIDGEEYVRRSDLRSFLAKANWIKVLMYSIHMRPSSWGYPTRPAKVNTDDPEDEEVPVNEWRNASDEVMGAVREALTKAGILKSREELRREMGL